MSRGLSTSSTEVGDSGNFGVDVLTTIRRGLSAVPVETRGSSESGACSVECLSPTVDFTPDVSREALSSLSNTPIMSSNFISGTGVSEVAFKVSFDVPDLGAVLNGGAFVKEGSTVLIKGVGVSVVWLNVVEIGSVFGAVLKGGAFVEERATVERALFVKRSIVAFPSVVSNVLRSILLSIFPRRAVVGDASLDASVPLSNDARFFPASGTSSFRENKT